MASREQVVQVLRNADAICFDVDSTVCMEEGIDQLAEFCEKGHEIREMYKRATQMTPSNDKELIAKLREKDKVPFLVSGGFDVLIQPLAEELAIPMDHVFANRIIFDSHGEYLDFDQDQLTSRSGGKGAVIAHLKKTRNFQVVVMIGDGATDLEAAPPADAFIGFGGNVIRPAVQQKAAWFVCDFEEIERIL